MKMIINKNGKVTLSGLTAMELDVLLAIAYTADKRCFNQQEDNGSWYSNEDFILFLTDEQRHGIGEDWKRDTKDLRRIINRAGAIPPTKPRIMKAIEINEEIIGKRCKSIFTGLMVTGVIEEIEIDRYTANVRVRFDEPHQWGDETHESGWSHTRLCDDFGSLHHLEIIDDKYRTIKVRFQKSIMEINRMFAYDYGTWGVVNLKEWIDNYESSRFTQINNDMAIITSEYNMDCIEEWLRKNTPVLSIETSI